MTWTSTDFSYDETLAVLDSCSFQLTLVCDLNLRLYNQIIREHLHDLPQARQDLIRVLAVVHCVNIFQNIIYSSKSLVKRTA